MAIMIYLIEVAGELLAILAIRFFDIQVKHYKMLIILTIQFSVCCHCVPRTDLSLSGLHLMFCSGESSFSALERQEDSLC